MNTPRALIQIAAAIAMMAATYTATVSTPAHTLSQPQRHGAAIALMLGALIIPATLTISAARDSQP